MKFNKAFANQYINDLLKKHKIKLHPKRSTTSSGTAWYKQRMIKIPNITTIDRFAVALHEIYHIIGKRTGRSFVDEFGCDMYARERLIELGYGTAEWDKRTKWHVLSRIAMSHNRGLDHANIPQDIREFFKDIDFSKWKGKKVFVGHHYWKSLNPKDIKFTVAMSKAEVEKQLEKQGLSLKKSQYDDSSYNMWLVGVAGACPTEFSNLSQIIEHYNLAI